MNIQARLNKTQNIMNKIEFHQDFNRLLFLCSLGILIHSLTCLGAPKKLNTLDYVGIPACALTIKRAQCLHKKEEKGQNLWHILQGKSATLC